MNKERKKQLKKENTQLYPFEIEAKKDQKIALEIFESLNLTEESTPEDILKAIFNSTYWKKDEK